MSPENGESRQRRIEGVRRFWSDPAKKEAAVAKIHTPASDDLRRQSALKYWEKNPGKRATQTRSAHEANEKARIARMINCLGENPKQALESLTNECLSVPEIAEKLGKSITATRYWLEKAGLKTKKATTLSRKTIRYRQSLVELATGANLMGYLLPKDCLVLQIRFGSERVVPPEEIKEQLGLKTKQRIAQIEARALSNLEGMLSGELIPENGVVNRRRHNRNKSAPTVKLFDRL